MSQKCHNRKSKHPESSEGTLKEGCAARLLSGAPGKAGAREVCAELIENGRVSKMCSLPPGFDCNSRVGLEHNLDGGAGICLASETDIGDSQVQLTVVELYGLQHRHRLFIPTQQDQGKAP